MPFTIPPNTRAVGTPDPAGDMDNVVNTLTASGARFNVQNTAFAGGADPTGAADSTAAFQACLTASSGTASQPAGEMIIPAGTYNLNTGNLQITGPVKIRGRGVGTTVGVMPNNTSQAGVILNCNGRGGSTSMFNWPALTGGLEMSNLQINYTGTGNVFNSVNFNGGVFRDMTVILTASGSQYMTCTGGNLCINMTHERCYITTTNAIRTAPMVSLVSTISAGVSESTWFRCGFTNSGLDMTQYMVFYGCSAPSGNGYHVADNFIDCYFEHPYGGCFQSLSGSCCKVDGCTVWDLQPSFGFQTTVAAGSNGGTISGIGAWGTPGAGILAVASTASFPARGCLSVAASGSTAAVITYTGISGNTFTGCTYISGSPSGTVATGGAVASATMGSNSLFYFGAYSGNNGSQGVQVLNTTRNQGATWLDGIHAWDIFCESTTSQVRVDSYTVLPSGAAVATNAWFNLGGCNDAVISNSTTPRGAGVNGNSATVITSPAAAQINLTGGVITGSYASNSWRPQDSGWLAWAYDPAPCAMIAATPQASGVMLIINVMLRDAPATISGIDLFVRSNGATLTAGQNLIGLYNAAGTLIGFSADQAAAWASGAPHDLNATLTAQSAGSLALVPTGMLRIGILAVGTTPPAFGCSTVTPGSARAFNGPNQTGATCRWGTFGTAQTALPTTITPSSITVAQQPIWAAVN